MSQPPNQPGHNPQWGGPASPDAPREPAEGPYDQGQPQPGPVGPDGQPHPGSVGQPQPGTVGPDGQPWNGPVGPDGQPWLGGSSAAGATGTRFGVKQLLLALVILVVLGILGFFVYQQFEKDSALAVGNCLVISGASDDADHELAECDDASVFSQYVGEVIEGSGTCEDPDAAPYSITETSRFGSEETTKVTCLIPQLIEGQCYGFLPENDVNLLEPLTCGDPNALIEVTQVIEGTTTECPADTEPIPYSVPERTYCLTYNE